MSRQPARATKAKKRLDAPHTDFVDAGDWAAEASWLEGWAQNITAYMDVLTLSYSGADIRLAVRESVRTWGRDIVRFADELAEREGGPSVSPTGLELLLSTDRA